MRVLHVDPERDWGGGQVQVIGLLAELVDRGVECTLAADPRGRLAREAANLPVRIEDLPIRNSLDAWAGFTLRRLARAADVVHFHTARAHALTPFLVGLPVRRVVTRRMDYRPGSGAIARALYNHGVDQVLAISHDVRRVLVEFGVRPDMIRVVPSGFDPRRLVVEDGARDRGRSALGVGDGDLVVLGLGALERRKGFDVLIAAAAVSSSDFRVVLAGDGSARADLEALAARLGVNVRMLGFREQVGELLASADIVAVPSRAEGLGIAALEALAAGRAVVASAVGGLTESVRHDQTGLLVPADDADALAQALDRMADAPLRTRLGTSAAADVRERFSMAAMAEGTHACYGSAR